MVNNPFLSSLWLWTVKVNRQWEVDDSVIYRAGLILKLYGSFLLSSRLASACVSAVDLGQNMA